jgi:hypothetical protein
MKYINFLFFLAIAFTHTAVKSEQDYKDPELEKILPPEELAQIKEEAKKEEAEGRRSSQQEIIEPIPAPKTTPKTKEKQAPEKAERSLREYGSEGRIYEPSQETRPGAALKTSPGEKALGSHIH